MPRNPYDRLAKVPSFDVSSTDVKDGEELAVPHRSGIFGAGGQDVSPQLSWEGFPAGTQSFAITVYDPNAPTPSGFYHWAVMDIPVTTTSLDTGAGDDEGSGLPAGAVQLPNDAGLRRFLGAAPPPGNGRSDYYIAIHAVDGPSLGLAPGSSPAFLGFNLSMHTLGRAIIAPWYEVPA
jgi:Raf kinase inhibitor-like YbhB/YbcL family protein